MDTEVCLSRGESWKNYLIWSRRLKMRVSQNIWKFCIIGVCSRISRKEVTLYSTALWLNWLLITLKWTLRIGKICIRIIILIRVKYKWWIWVELRIKMISLWHLNVNGSTIPLPVVLPSPLPVVLPSPSLTLNFIALRVEVEEYMEKYKEEDVRVFIRASGTEDCVKIHVESN